MLKKNYKLNSIQAEKLDNYLLSLLRMELERDYNNLDSEYTNLKNKYENLNNNYNTLENNYNSLKNEYDSIINSKRYKAVNKMLKTFGK